jgi:acetyl esterase/lipase
MARPSRQRIIGILLVSLVAIHCSGWLPQSLADQPDSAKATHRVIENICYRSEDAALTDEVRAKCQLDLRVPAGVTGFPTIVWFHGGGLTSGKRSFPDELNRKDVAVATVSYRLHPDVSAPVYIEDAAAAIAWVIEHISEHGGSADRVVISGHSAGGYLAAMVGLEKRWLAAHQIDADTLAGIAPISGQMITHFTIRKERGVEDTRPVIDEFAPLNHLRKDAPPILLVTGDRELELLARYEENAYAWRMLQKLEHPDAVLYELDGYDHGQMVRPALPLLLKFVDRVTAKPKPLNVQ